jgi:hypothetical protein
VLLGLLLALEQLGPHRRRAAHDLARRQVGLGDREGARRGGRLLHADPPVLALDRSTVLFA